MENKKVAKSIKLIGDLMELHGENPFKTKGFNFAFDVLRKIARPFSEFSIEELQSVSGLNQKMSKRVIELAQNDALQELDDLIQKTPVGVVEMLQIRGVGVKKVLVFWKELNLLSIGDLIQTCNENRLCEIKGFGLKSQSDILQKAMLYQNSKGKIIFAYAEPIIQTLQKEIEQISEIKNIRLTGSSFRKEQIISKIEFVVESDIWPIHFPFLEELTIDGNTIEGIFQESIKTIVIQSINAPLDAFINSFTEEVFAKKLNRKDVTENFISENETFKKFGLPFIIPELRNHELGFDLSEDKIIKLSDIKGIIHNHSDYSDGINTLDEICAYVAKNNFEYFAITDHSKAAAYANGLQEERIEMQHREIEILKKKYPQLKIFKSIECDILRNGDLDYDESVLNTFDFIICSIHSVLNMDIDDATSRLIKAIEHPNCNILGHLTGRLLCSRSGYPLHMEKILDACAINKVAIELNSNPQRLDIDFSYLRKAMDKGIFISINPDAHSKEAIHDIKYGVIAARCGGLESSSVINTYKADEFLRKLEKS